MTPHELRQRAASTRDQLFACQLFDDRARRGRRALWQDRISRLSRWSVSANERRRQEPSGRSASKLARAPSLTEGPPAEELYLEAIDRLARCRIAPERARAHLLYGEWLRRESRRVDAREQLRTAHDMLAAIGMDAFAERARRELAATGEKVRRRRAETLDELTAQEAQIAQLAHDGYSNPEIAAQLFLSARTVEWHLRKVFQKLGCVVTQRPQPGIRVSRSTTVRASLVHRYLTGSADESDA